MHLDGAQEQPATAIDARDLMCPICMNVAGDPHVTSCCNRVFCLKDADTSQYPNGCPLCRKKHFSFKSSPKHKQVLEQLTIKCVCSEYILPDEYDAHLDRCSNATFPCPHNTCREKNDNTKFNAEQLVQHLARYHCNEVSLHGSTFINKQSIEPLKVASAKYESIVSTLYAVVYPKMIEIQMKNSSSNKRVSTALKCPEGHKLIEADYSKRKRKNGSLYSSASFSCDVCHHSFNDGVSWHCSCTDVGFDKCVACLVFDICNVDNSILKLAAKDREKQQERYRQAAFSNLARLPQSLFRLLVGSTDDDDDDDDDDEEEEDVDVRRDVFAIRQISAPPTQEGTSSNARNSGETVIESQ